MTTTLSSTLRAAVQVPRFDAHAFGCRALAAGAVGYLGLEGGGYDAVVHSQAGLAVWWVLLLGLVVGVLSTARLGLVGRAGLGLIVGFASLTVLSVAWSDTPDGALAEGTRVALYAGVFALAACAIRGADSTRHLLTGVALGVTLVAAVALASRIFPGSFPKPDPALARLPADQGRLAYPLNYWNGLAALCAIGLPALLASARTARTIGMQAFAAGAIPIVVSTVYLTGSRAGALATAVAVLAFLLLTGDRLAALATAVAGGLASALLVVAIGQRDDLERLASGSASTTLLLVLVSCLGAALLQVAFSLIGRYAHRPAALRPPPRTMAAVGAGAAVAALAVALVAGVPGAMADRWEEFKLTAPASSAEQRSDEGLFDRLEGSSGRGRYEMWQVAADAFSDRPLIGQGAGSFRLWWAENRPEESSFVRNAHSLYMETLADLGLVGLCLLVGFLLVLIVGGIVALARQRAADRVTVAAGIAGLLAFAACVAVDWSWQIPAVAIAALVCGAATLQPRRASRQRAGARGARLALAAVSIAAILVLAVSLTDTMLVRSSQAAARDGQLVTAVKDARTAAELQPFAMAPRLQLALVLERAGEFDLARVEIGKAIEAEPNNWQPWFVAARIDAERGAAAAALREFRRARELNPRSRVFTPTGGTR